MRTGRRRALLLRLRSLLQVSISVRTGVAVPEVVVGDFPVAAGRAAFAGNGGAVAARIVELSMPGACDGALLRVGSTPDRSSVPDKHTVVTRGIRLGWNADTWMLPETTTSLGLEYQRRRLGMERDMAGSLGCLAGERRLVCRRVTVGTGTVGLVFVIPCVL